MTVAVHDLASAQGVADEYAALLRLREGFGVQSQWDLRILPPPVRERLFGIVGEHETDLDACLKRLTRLVDESPAQEADLLRLSFNLRPEPPAISWTARRTDWLKTNGSASASELEEDADLAILQMIMRTHPAAEAVPAPVSLSASSTWRDTYVHASEFLREDYVANSGHFRNAWKASTSVDVLGFSHNRMVVAYSGEIRALLGAGGRLRVLAQDPEGTAVLEANRRSSAPKTTDESVRHQHRAGVVTLLALGDQATSGGGSVEIRGFDFMPPFTSYFFHLPNGDSEVYIWYWTWRQPSSLRPGFRIVQKLDEDWYERFLIQFEDLWHHCSESILR